MHAKTFRRSPARFALIMFISSACSTLVLHGCAPDKTSPVTEPPQKLVCTANADEIFAEVEPETAPDVETSDSGRRVKRQRKVAVDFKTLRPRLKTKGALLSLNLFRDRSISLKIKETQSYSSDNTVATADVMGDVQGNATIVVKNNVMVANVHLTKTHEHFEVRYSADGTHSIEAVEPGDEGCETAEVPEEDQSAEDIGEMSVMATTPIIDMLVVYTPAALAKQGSTSAMLALIQLGVADTNNAFTKAGLNLQVRLVGTLALKTNESSGWSTDLSALKGTSDGRWDEVHAERARLGADQVSLIGAYADGGSTAGIAYISATASTAFSITKTSTFSQYTFTHELGHNIGLRHENGFVNTSGSFRTIMAYGSVKRIGRFSSSTLKYNGYALGDSSHDSTAIISTNINRIPNLMASKVPSPTPTPTPTPTATPEPGEPTPTPTPTPEPGQKPSDPGEETVTCPT